MAEGLRDVLDRIGLADLFDVFMAHDIDAVSLSELTEGDLRELGLTMGQRKRVLRALRAPAAPSPPVAQPAPTARDTGPKAERRQLTTLFCDLIGSTHLATVLDPEDMREVIEAYLDLCSSVIRAHGGHVAFSQGDGVMAYFGFPVAGEDDPVRAVRAGFEVVARLGSLKTPSTDPLAVRVGIATGVVVVGESHDPSVPGGMVVGETPNLAARLQNIAGSGEVVISEATRQLCGGLFEYQPRGDVELKGFPAPVSVYRVTGESGAANRFEARARTGLNPLIGRDAELNILLGQWRTARGSSGQVAVISGDPGIGKSRLARAFIEAVAGDEPLIMRWYCAAHLANRALHPLVRALESLEGLARTAPDPKRLAALERWTSEAPLLNADDVPFLADLLGIEAGPRPDLDPVARARWTYDTLVRGIEGEARQGPVLLVLEDAHWADPATLDFLGLLIERIAALPVLLLVTHRPEFVAPWRIGERGATIALEALDAADGARLVEMVMRERVLPHAVLRKILEKAAGVPFFVEELTRTILDTLLNQASGANPLASLSIPATLQDSLMSRLDQLGEAKELALVGSVIGREFTSAMLRVVAPDYPDLEAGLRRLCDSGLAYESGRPGGRAVIFHHALLQDAAYESILRRRRREIHRAIARAMVADDPAFAGTEPEVIARHCTRGDLPAEAVGYWLGAGLHALDRAAAGPALVYLRAAMEQLELLPEDEARARTELRIQMALAPATMAIHGWAAPEVEAVCSRANQLAIQTGDHESMFASAWGLWSNFFLRGQMDPALEAALSVDGMARASGNPVLLVAADHAIGFTQFYRGEVADALAKAREGSDRCTDAIDQQIVRLFQLSSATVLQAIAAPSLWITGQEAEAEAMLASSIALAERIGHAPTLAFCYGHANWLLVQMRDWTRVRENALRMIALSEPEGFQLWLTLGHLFAALADAAEGVQAAGLAAVLDCFDKFAATGTGLCQSQVHVPISELMISSGRAGEAIDRLGVRIDSATRRHEGVYLSELHRVRGLAHHALGSHALAQTDLKIACDIARRQGAAMLLRRAEASLQAITLADTVQPDAASRMASIHGETGHE